MFREINNDLFSSHFFFLSFFFISWAQVASVGEAVTGGSRQLEEVHNSLMVRP